jgi:hypothetical protein
MLGPLQDNGGPTMTHALGAGSVAIDVIPADICEVTEDQRGEPLLRSEVASAKQPRSEKAELGADADG